MTDSADFDWNEAQDHGSVVQQRHQRVAIYTNPHEDLVIRQERDWDEEYDPFIVISCAHAVTASHAILEAIGLGEVEFIRPCRGGGYEDVPIRPEVAAIMARRPDIDWKAVNADFNAIESEVVEPRNSSLKDRRARVAGALRSNPTRSNRAIAANCDVSDKTVAAVRAEIGAEIAVTLRKSALRRCSLGSLPRSSSRTIPRLSAARSAYCWGC